jgi:hypothetical protein
MAFGYNQPQNFGETISTVADAQRNTQFQTALQERFDVNNAKLDEAIMKVSSIPLLREKDQEYLKQKLSNVLNEVNGNLKASGGRSLLNNNLTGHLSKLIGSSIDDYLVTQMGIAQQKQSFDASMAKLQEKGDGKFSGTNYAYALDKAGWGDYLEGKTDNLKSGFTYTPFSDYTANAMKKLKEIIDIKGDMIVEKPDGAGGVIKVKMSGLSPQELAEVSPMLFSEQDRQQMVIDGWVLGKQDPEGVKNIYSNLVQANIVALEKEMSIADSRIEDVNLSAEERQTAEQRKKAIQAQIELYENQKNSTDLELMGYTVKKKEIDNLILSGLVGRTQQSYDKDDVFLANQKLNAAIKKQEADAETAFGAPGSVQTTVLEEGDVTGVQAYTSVKQSHDKAYNEIVGRGLQFLEDGIIDESKKAQFEQSLNKQGFVVQRKPDGSTTIVNDPNWKGKSHSKAHAVNEALVSSGALSTAELTQLKKALNTKNTLATALIEANKSFGKDVNTDELVETLNKAKGILTSALPFRMFDLEDLISDAGSAIKSIPNMISGEGEPTETSGQKRLMKASEIDKFIKDNGGVANLKQKMKSNPALAQQVITLLDGASDVDSQISRFDYSGGNLTRNLNQAGERLKQLGALPYTKDKYNIQVTDKKARESLLNSIDQSLPLQGDAFDPKRAITIVPEYNSRGVVESFIITQQADKMTKQDGDQVQKISSSVKVSASSLAGQKIMSTVNQNDNLDAMKTPNSARITPMKVRINTPFPTTIPDTDREWDEALGVLGADIQKTVAGQILNPVNKNTVRNNAINYMKGQLLDKYSEKEIEQLYSTIESGFKNGNFSTALVPNKMPNSGTAKWLLDVKYNNSPILKANYTNSNVMASSMENYFIAYPQFVVLEKIVEQYRIGNKIF